MSAGAPTKIQDRIDLDGVSTYYEIDGSGPPLVLLHGGFCPIETFAGLVPPLAERFTVHAPERRGHGRTPDVDGPITYAVMATDTVAYLEAQGLGPADLVGWSDGGIVGLLVALARPDLVRRFVMVGAQVNPSGMPPEMLAMLKHAGPDMLPPQLRDLYAAVSPDGPDHFEIVFDKLITEWRVEPNLELDELAGLAAPTLVVVADGDLVTVAHADAVRQAMPDAQLAVVPGADHGFPMERPDVLSRLVLDFLRD